jgi:hypothetical protein
MQKTGEVYQMWSGLPRHFHASAHSSRQIADYPKDWPFPTESLTAQEKTGESALQGNSHGFVEARLILAKFHRFVTRMPL